VRVSLVLAAARGGVIGREGGLPWRMPADMRHFKALTMGHHVVMGRKTHDSIGRPLPGRVNVVLSRDPRLEIEGCRVVQTLDDALAVAKAANESEVFVIGGAQIYALALARADRIHLTRIDADLEGDTHAPDFEALGWREVQRQEHPADAANPHPHAFCVLERTP
jgi:dihydrofolate reductase